MLMNVETSRTLRTNGVVSKWQWLTVVCHVAVFVGTSPNPPFPATITQQTRDVSSSCLFAMHGSFLQHPFFYFHFYFISCHDFLFSFIFILQLFLPVALWDRPVLLVSVVVVVAVVAALWACILISTAVSISSITISVNLAQENLSVTAAGARNLPPSLPAPPAACTASRSWKIFIVTGAQHQVWP